MGWLEGYQIRPGSQDNVPLFPLPALTMVCCWGLAISPAPAPPAPVASPCFPGPGTDCTTPASPLASSSLTWSEGSQRANQLTVAPEGCQWGDGGSGGCH